MRLDTVDRHREAADPVAVGADEIGEAHIGTALALGDLLAQEGDADVAFLFLEVDDDVVTLAPARPEARDALRVKPAFADDAVEHCLRVGKKTARAFPHDRVVERSEESRGGKECVRTCRNRWSPDP